MGVGKIIYWIIYISCLPEKVKSISQFVFLIFFNAQCIIYDTFSFLNFGELWCLIKPISDKWSQLKLFILTSCLHLNCLSSSLTYLSSQYPGHGTKKEECSIYNTPDTRGLKSVKFLYLFSILVDIIVDLMLIHRLKKNLSQLSECQGFGS